MPIIPLCSETHLTRGYCEIPNSSPRMWFVDIFQIVLHFWPFKYGSKVMLFHLKESITFRASKCMMQVDPGKVCRYSTDQEMTVVHSNSLSQFVLKPLYWASWHLHSQFFWRYSLILSFYLCTYFLSGFFPRSFQTVLYKYMHILFPPYMMLALLIWSSLI